MSIASKRGDDGNTPLVGGRRVPKDDPRIEAQGTLEELNAHVSLARAAGLPPLADAVLARIQSELLDLSVEIATPREANPQASRVPHFPVAALDGLERDLQQLEDSLPPLTAVILPGGHEVAARLHVCRGVCRRAERGVVAVARHDRLPGVALGYLNRLGDLFFVMARWVNAQEGVAEPEWNSREERGPADG